MRGGTGAGAALDGISIVKNPDSFAVAEIGPGWTTVVPPPVATGTRKLVVTVTFAYLAGLPAT